MLKYFVVWLILAVILLIFNYGAHKDDDELDFDQ